MGFSPDELKDYLLDELTPERKAAVETLLRNSAEAREELDRQRLLLQALRALPEAEPPQRIALVAGPSPVAPPNRWRGAGVLPGTARAAAIAAAVTLAIVCGIWALEPTLSRDAAGWTLSFGSPAVVRGSALTEEQLRAAIRAELSGTEDRLRQTVLEVGRTGTEDWMRSELKAVRQELAEVHEDAVAGYQFVNAKHELLKRQLLEFEVAAVPDGQP